MIKKLLNDNQIFTLKRDVERRTVAGIKELLKETDIGDDVYDYLIGIGQHLMEYIREFDINVHIE